MKKTAMCAHSLCNLAPCTSGLRGLLLQIGAGMVSSQHVLSFDLEMSFFLQIFFIILFNTDLNFAQKDKGQRTSAKRAQISVSSAEQSANSTGGEKEEDFLFKELCKMARNIVQCKICKNISPFKNPTWHSTHPTSVHHVASGRVLHVFAFQFCLYLSYFCICIK